MQKNGVEVQAKVTEVSPSHISYKKYSNLNGPVYIMSISDVFMITYENGEREIYNKIEESIQASVLKPQGIMAYNGWSGQISIGGIVVEKAMLKQCFTPSDYQMFKRGRTAVIVGGVLACVSAVPLGLGIGFLEPIIVIPSGAVFVTGIITSLVGESRMKKAIRNYNANLACQPEIRFNAIGNGVGLTIAF